MSSSTFSYPSIYRKYPPGGQTYRPFTDLDIRRIVQEELAKKDEPTPEAAYAVTLTEREARWLVSLLSSIRAKLETASADA